MPRTIFARKSEDLNQLKLDLEALRRLFPSPEETDYYVAEEKELSEPEWADLTKSLLKDRSWIKEFTEKEPVYKGGVPCIRATCPSSEIALIIDPQGYSYARYVGIEPAELSNRDQRTWYDTEGQRVVTGAELREEYESLPADQREAMTFEEYIRMGEAETLRRFSIAASSEIEDDPEDEWDDEPAEGLTEEAVEQALWGMLIGEWDVDNSLLMGCSARTYSDAGVLTYNKGLVITMPDGSEFQLTIVQSR